MAGKREQILGLCKFAGYHNDQRQLIRLIVENRISRTVAIEAFDKGKDARTNDMKCNCFDCTDVRRPEMRNRAG